MFVPDIEVYVKNTVTGALSPKVKTDLKGASSFPAQPAGTYQLCWESPGYIAGCRADKVVIDTLTVFPLPVRITRKQT